MKNNRTPEEAGDFLQNLQVLLRSIGSNDGHMEQVSLLAVHNHVILSPCKGSLRCDANISVNPLGGPIGIRTEIKNMNSIRFMIAALG